MVRKARQPSLNSSVVTVTNNSILDDGEPDYSEFIKRFCKPELNDKIKIEPIGCARAIEILEKKFKCLLSKDSKEQEFSFITGPSSTGKTTVVKQLAEQYEKEGLTFFYLKSSWIIQKRFGDPETRLPSLFNEAIQRAPSLIFIDEIDLICSERRSQNDARDRIQSVLRDELEILKGVSAKVLVLAATDTPESLDQTIKKSRYFSEEIKFTLPDQNDRVEILKHILSSQKNNLTEKEIERVAQDSHCYSHKELSKLCNIALKMSQSDELDFQSLKQAQSRFKPYAIKSITTPCPPLRWEDIGGVEDVKRELQESVIWPLEHRDKFKRIGIQSNKGALLYGPPGCSKTMLAQALATESGYNFISVKGPELFSKYVGDSEAAVRKLYRGAREIAPCIIFFDEIDGFAPERNDKQSSSVGDKVVATLLTELNGIEPLDNVYTIAATNRPDKVDSALLRPGRLDPAIYIPLPSAKDRRAIFQVHMRPLSMKFDEDQELVLNRLARMTEHYSGAEIANVCRVAGTLALRESLDNEHVEWKHFKDALIKVRPRTKMEQLKAYEEFQERSLQSGTILQNSNLVATNGLTSASKVSESDIESLSDDAVVKGKKRFDLDKLMRSLRLKKHTS